MTAPPPDTLRVGVVTAAFGFDPHQPFDYGTSLLMEQLFEPLYRVAPASGGVEPLAASELPRSLTGSSVVAPLRDGLRFWDGTPVTPAAAAVAIDRALADTPGVRARAADVGVRFDLDRPDPQLALRLTNPWWSVAKRGPGGWIGTGAYRLHEASTPQRVVLEANPHHRAPVSIPRVVMQTYPSSGDGTALALVQAIERGEVDFANQVPREALAGLPDVDRHVRPGHSTAFLWIDTDRVADVEVRRALLAALDRRRLAALDHDNPAGFVAKSVLPPGWSSYRVRDRLDVEAARRGLEGRGLKLRLLVIWGARAYLPRPLRVARGIVRMLADVGVEVELVQAEDALDYVDRATSGKYDLLLGGWNADSPDAVSFLEALFDSSSVPDRLNPVGCNFSRWRDGLVDAALQRVRTTVGPDAERELMEMVEDAAILLPINYGAVTAVTSRRLGPVDVDGRGMVKFGALSFATSLHEALEPAQRSVG